MPSKSRKNPKTPLKLSYSDSSTSVSSTPPPPRPEVTEEDIHSLLEEASVKYPSLISKDAFVGKIVDTESGPGSHTATIWLSEPAMVASRLIPGSIVSVSLASSREKLLSSPLDSLVDECGHRYGFDVSDKRDYEAGSYFALAVVYPSSKVLKYGVRLSQSLFCTMGNPALGKITFVSLIQTRSTDGPLDRASKLHNSTIMSDSCLSLCNCRDLYLELDPAKNPPGINSDMQYAINSISEALGDEKSRELLETCASLCLRARLLLRGNLVAVSIGAKSFMFLVREANTLTIEFPSEDIICEAKDVTGLHDNQVVDVDHVNVALFIDCKTKVHLRSPLPSVAYEGSGLPTAELGCLKSKDKEAGHAIRLGGLSKEYAILKEVIISSSVNGPLASSGLRSIKGVLLHGPPGTGKTSFARSCVEDAGFKLFLLNGPEIISQYLGESEQALCEVFDSASQAAPAVVFIDELDAIAPARKDGGDELSQRMVATLLNLMDGISRTDGILVIAATNRPDSIDPALRRPGRLDREIEIGVPSPKQRFDILNNLLKAMDHSLVDTQIQHLASSTHGFVGADLAALCNEAALICLRRHVKFKNSCETSAMELVSARCKEQCIGYHRCSDDIMGLSTNNGTSVLSHSDSAVSSETIQSFHFKTEHQQRLVTSESADHFSSEEVTSELVQETSLKVCFGDFEKAKIKVRPSAMREVILEVPKVRWDDVGGQNEVKRQLMEAVEWPQKHQDAFKRIGTRPPTGVLLFGPPGCSKTLMARAVASEAGLNFLAVKGPELFSKWVGESEKAVKTLFAKARANAPSIIFFDEIDGLAIIRGKENDGASVSDRVMSQLLVELDGLHQRVDVTVIAATNRPDKIDPALLRPGRFDRLLYVGPPNEADREDIFRIHVRRMPCSSDVSTRELARLTDGYTGADISLICRESALAAIEGSLDAAEITMANFVTGLGRVQSSEVRSYQEFSVKFQRHVLSGRISDDGGCQLSSSACSRVAFWNQVKSLLLIIRGFFFRW